MARDAVDDLSDLDEETVAEIRAAVDHQERRELQRLAKLRGIKANQKTQVLVEELARRLAAYDAGARSATPPPPPAVPVPASIPARRRNAQAPAYQLEIPNLDEPLPPPTAEEMARSAASQGPRRGDGRWRSAASRSCAAPQTRRPRRRPRRGRP